MGCPHRGGSTVQLIKLTAVNIGISVLMHIVWHGALDVGKARRLDRQNLETNLLCIMRSCDQWHIPHTPLRRGDLSWHASACNSWETPRP